MGADPFPLTSRMKHVGKLNWMPPKKTLGFVFQMNVEAVET